MQTRVKRLMESMGVAPDAAVVIHKPSNIFYLSGFTGEGLLLLGANMKAVVTDFRYTEQAGRQSPEFETLEISGGVTHETLAGNRMRDMQIKHVFYEDDFITVKAFEAMRTAFDGMTLAPVNGAPEKLRAIKDADEIARIERACAASCEAFDWILGEIKPGMTESELRLKLDFKLMSLGEAATAFATIVASGENGSLPHAIPGGRRLQKGDMITMDFGAKWAGYCADMTRTVALGDPSEQMQRVYDTVLRAQETAENALKPGLVCRDADAIARDIINAAGYEGCFGHGLGHAVGIDIHENPRLSARCGDLLVPGHVVTVEPGVYLPGVGGVRIENTCVITETGARSLVTADKSLIKL